MRKLQVAFSRKEKVERLLSNLENLKNEGAIEQSQYQALKDNYSRILSDYRNSQCRYHGPYGRTQTIDTILSACVD